MSLALREHCDRRLGSMRSVRSDYEAEYRDIARWAQPSRTRFLEQKSNQNTKRRIRNAKLLDPHGIEAFRTLANGMTSGLSSPSRPWFKLKLPDPDLDQKQEVREYLHEAERRMYAFLAQINFYSSVKAGYSELGLFGTEACVMVEHPTAAAVCHALTAGEYWISLSDAMQPDTLARQCWMSARQVVQSFGNDAPRAVRASFDKSDGERPVQVWNIIEPNADFKPDRFGSKAWRSVYWTDEGDDKVILSERGFDQQPFWSPRWDVVGGDTYGVSPGMEALPALRELQAQTKRRNEAVDFLVMPEKIVPPGVNLTGEPNRIVSGANVTNEQIIVPYQMPYQAVTALAEEVEKCRTQINALSYADLFNAITNMQGIQPRNVEEIASRNEEKLTQLGPVIERVSTEKLNIVIDRVFDIMSRARLLPPPPESVAGKFIDVEFVSILQQMQRAVGIGQIERNMSFAGNSAAVAPQILDNYDFDEIAREYAERTGLPANAMVSRRQVEQNRQQRAQQEQAQQAAETMPALRDGADAARLLSETDVGGESLLERSLGI